MPGFLFVTTLVSAILSLPLGKLSGKRVWVLLAVAISAAMIISFAGWPWLLNIFVFASYVVGGALIGRAIPASPVAMALFLAIISTLDILWIVMAGNTPTPFNSYTDFSLEFGSVVSSIGSFDLILASAITTHWRRRKATIFLSLAPAPLGMILSNVFFSIVGMANLALVPFISAGWLISQSWHLLKNGKTDRP